MNLLIASGNLVKDAVLRTTPNGKQVLSWTIANNEGHGEHERVTYYDCSMFGERSAKLEQYFTKGLKLVVTGVHSTDKSEKNGNVYFNNRIFVHNFEFAGGKQDGAQGAPQASGQGYQNAKNNAPQNDGFEDESMPF